MKRRDFIKTTLGGMAALVVGSKIPGVLDNPAYAATYTQTLNFTITDAIKEMVTHNAINTAECYFWVFKEANFPAEVPGPTIFTTQGDTIRISITNALDEPHAFRIPNIFNSGPIAPGATVTRVFSPTRTGTHLYLDDLNAPVNRVMGLHGAFIVMPAAPSGAKFTPYATATPQVQQLFDDLGTAAWWPGLSWQDGNPATLTPPFRQYVWLCHQASPTLFRDVGSLPPGEIFNPTTFTNRFLRDAFNRNNFNLATASDTPQYFTINGQSGHFGHSNPVNTPLIRVGEPFIIRVLNAGLMTHSMHMHANHFYMLSVDGVVQGAPVGAGANNATLLRPGPIWVDTFTLNAFGSPSSRFDFLVPAMRPPDVPNTRGIGRGGAPDAALPTLAGGTTWPPLEEFEVRLYNDIPVFSSEDGVTPVSNASRQSPLCFPVHDHSEPSQTAQGGNYNCGLISGLNFIGDHNVPLAAKNVTIVQPDGTATDTGPPLPPQTFPMDEDAFMMIFNTTTEDYIAYGIDEARRNGIMEPSKDSQLDSQAPRPDFP